MKKQLTAKTFMTSTKNVPVGTTEDRLENVLPATRSSHDPVFLYDKKGVFFGLISTHVTRYQRRFPLSTKVKQWRNYIVPPTILPSTSLQRVAQFMVDTRIYTLPVFHENQKEVIGVVSAPVILRRISQRHKDVLKEIAKHLHPMSPATIDMHASLGEVYHFLRSAGRSRVILVNEKGKVEGIITRRDVEKAFRKRRKKDRFSIRTSGNWWSETFTQDEVPDSSVPAITFAITQPLTALDNTENTELIRRLLQYSKPSIILANKQNKPTGLISTRSILNAIQAITPKREIPVLFHHEPLKSLGEFRVEKLKIMLNTFAGKINRQEPVQRIELTIEGPRNQVQKTIMHNIKLRVLCWSGKRYIAHEKQYAQKTKHIGLEAGVRNAMKEIETQLRRDRRR